MSDWLVEVQQSLAAYPRWVVTGAGVVAVAGLFLMIGKAMRMFGLILFIVGLAAAGWLAWAHFFGN